VTASVDTTGSSSPASSRPVVGDRGGVGAVVAALLVFSWGFPLVKLLPLPAATLTTWRLVIGAAVLLAVAAVRRTAWPRHAVPVVVTGLAFGVHQLLFAAATQRTTIATVTLASALQPMLVAMVSRRTVGEAVPRALIGWSVCAVAGIAIVVQATLGDGARSLTGDLLAVANLFAYTGYFLASKWGREDGAPTLTFTACVFVVALAVTTPVMLLGGQAAPTSGAQWAVIALLALGPGNGHLLVNWAHPRVSAALSSLVLAALPLLSSVWAALLFDEPYTLRHVAGMLLVLAAVEGGRRAERRGRAAAARDDQAAIAEPVV